MLVRSSIRDLVKNISREHYAVSYNLEVSTLYKFLPFKYKLQGGSNTIHIEKKSIQAKLIPCKIHQGALISLWQS